jgi:hypothetical protein
MKRIAAAVCALCFFAITAFAGETMTGWVTDEKCGARVANEKGANCAKKCVEQGQPAVFVSDKDQTVLPVDNQDKIKEFAGQHVKVSGTVADNKLHVESVEKAAETKGK